MELFRDACLSLHCLPIYSFYLIPHNLCSTLTLSHISEWDIKSYFFKLLLQCSSSATVVSHSFASAQQTKDSPKGNQGDNLELQQVQKDQEKKKFEEQDQPFFHLGIQKKNTTILIELIFLNPLEYCHAIRVIHQLTFHLIAGTKFAIQPLTNHQESCDEINRKLMRNRSLWIRNLPSKLLKLPSPLDIITEQHLIWRILTEISGEGIERMEVTQSRNQKQMNDSVIQFESDLCVRFTSAEECQRVLQLCCGTMGDPRQSSSDQSRSLILCRENESKGAQYLQKLEVTLDTEGYLRTTARHKREREREKAAALKRKMDRDIADAESEFQNLSNDMTKLSRDYQDTFKEDQSSCSVLCKAKSEAEIALLDLTEVIQHARQQCVESQASRVRSQLHNAQDRASYCLKYLKSQFILACDQNIERRKQLEAEEAQRLQLQTISHGERLLQELESKCHQATLVAEQHDISRKLFYDTLQCVDPSWISDPPQLFLSLFDQQLKQSKSLLNALRKLLTKKNSFVSIQTCCDMLEVEWSKVQPRIQTMDCISEIETNLFSTLEKLKILLSFPHSDSVQTIILTCLRIISAIFQRHQSLLTEAENSTAAWFDKILTASVAVRGIVDPLVQYIGTTETLIDIADRYLVTSIPSPEGVRSALDSSRYRLVRLESLATSILKHYLPSSLNSMIVVVPQSKEINSFTNSCAVSHLELSAAVMEIETQLMSTEDQLSKFRENQEYLEEQLLEERWLEMALEDERSSLCDSIWFLEREKEKLLERQQDSRVEDTDRWMARNDDSIDIIIQEPPWREEAKGSKRKRSHSLSETNETKVSAPSLPTADPKGNEMELRRILLDRFSKKKKIEPQL
jgi:hypothetical protein